MEIDIILYIRNKCTQMDTRFFVIVFSKDMYVKVINREMSVTYPVSLSITCWLCVAGSEDCLLWSLGLFICFEFFGSVPCQFSGQFAT